MDRRCWHPRSLRVGVNGIVEDSGELPEGGELLVTKGGEGISGGRILEGMGEVGRGTHSVFGGGNVRDRDGIREESYRVGYSNGVCFWDEYFPTTVVAHGGANDDTLGAVCGPCATVPGFIMGDNLHAGRGERGAIVVEVTVKLRVGGELGIDTTLAEDIEGDFGLR